jgi:hypothetical protein
LKALVLMGAFFLVAGLIWRRTGSALWAAAGMALAGWASQYSMHLRPPVITYFMMAAYLHLLFNLRKGKWTTATQIVSFPFMALWINLHGGAILGLVLTGLHFAPALAAATLGGSGRNCATPGKCARARPPVWASPCHRPGRLAVQPVHLSHSPVDPESDGQSGTAAVCFRAATARFQVYHRL